MIHFSKIGGTGVIKCKKCGYKKKIVSFLHGFSSKGEQPWCSTGFQCQSCGKFHTIEYDLDNEKGVKCKCGGILDRDKPLFCPKCISKSLDYMMDYIT